MYEQEIICRFTQSHGTAFHCSARKQLYLWFENLASLYFILDRRKKRYQTYQSRLRCHSFMMQQMFSAGKRCGLQARQCPHSFTTKPWLSGWTMQGLSLKRSDILLWNPCKSFSIDSVLPDLRDAGFRTEYSWTLDNSGLLPHTAFPYWIMNNCIY